jgi:hypothetical protein
VNRFILDPKNAEFLSLIKSARNGAVYGTKIRFPHALVYVSCTFEGKDWGKQGSDIW